MYACHEKRKGVNTAGIAFTVGTLHCQTTAEECKRLIDLLERRGTPVAETVAIRLVYALTRQNGHA